MTPLQELERVLHEHVPGVVTEYDPPFYPTGNHDLQVRAEGQRINVRWRDDFHFRVDDGRDPDGVLDAVEWVQLNTVDAALRHVLHLIRNPESVADAR